MFYWLCDIILNNNVNDIIGDYLNNESATMLVPALNVTTSSASDVITSSGLSYLGIGVSFCLASYFAFTALQQHLTALPSEEIDERPLTIRKSGDIKKSSFHTNNECDDRFTELLFSKCTRNQPHHTLLPAQQTTSMPRYFDEDVYRRINQY